jgi:hypothetical protein
MAAIQLPLWFVTAQTTPPPQPPPENPPVPYVFTSTGKLAAFMDDHGSGRWDVIHADDQHSLLITVADLHRARALRAYVDPAPDGSDGEFVSIATVLAASACE